MERPTQVNVEGFDRFNAKAEFDALNLKTNDVIASANRLKGSSSSLKKTTRSWMKGLKIRIKLF